MGDYAFNGMFNLSGSDDWPIRNNRLEGNCNILKFYCFNVNIKYGNEHSCDS